MTNSLSYGLFVDKFNSNTKNCFTLVLNYEDKQLDTNTFYSPTNINLPHMINKTQCEPQLNNDFAVMWLYLRICENLAKGATEPPEKARELVNTR